MSLLSTDGHTLLYHLPLFISYILFLLINLSFDTCWIRPNPDSTYYSFLFDHDYNINPSSSSYLSLSNNMNNNNNMNNHNNDVIKNSLKSYSLIYFLYLFCFILPSIIILFFQNNSFFIIGKIILPYYFYISWFGVFLIFIGIWLRWYAMRINKFFNRILRIGEGQFIVTEGPYRYVRHPGYLGQLLIWNGFGLSSGNYLIALIIFIIITFTYLYRIRKEEVILLRIFGVDYLEYSTRVSRLIPYIY